ncbi:MAG: insulinase family protein [Planctomycetes bacterium]|nr:insulinase family protein [Planctomycetota bacterium]
MFCAYIGVGSRHEKREEQGISHFLEHMLFQGAGRYRDAAALTASAESLGGVINALTLPEHTCVYLSAHRRYWGTALSILAQMVVSPSLRDAQIGRERRVILQEMRQSLDDHGRNFNIDDLAYNLLWQEPSAREATPVGDERRISRIDRPALRSHHRRHYTAGRVVLAVSGEFEWGLVLRSAGRLFSGLPSGEGERPAKPPVVPQTSARSVWRTARDWPTVSLKLCHRAFSARDPRYAATLLLDESLGGGSSSRLFLRAREERGLVYDIASEVVSFSDVGSLDISTSVEAGNLVDTAREILSELRRVRRTGLGEREFREVRQRLVCQTEMMEDDPYALADWYARQVLSGEPPLERPADLARRIRRVTRAQVRAIAREVLSPERRGLAVVGPFTRTQRKRVEGMLRRG